MASKLIVVKRRINTKMVKGSVVFLQNGYLIFFPLLNYISREYIPQFADVTYAQKNSRFEGHFFSQKFRYSLYHYTAKCTLQRRKYFTNS